MSMTNSVSTAEEFAFWVKSIHDELGPGADPGLGTLNNIDAAARARGYGAMRTGDAVGIAARLQPGPTVRGGDTSAFGLEIYAEGGAEGFELGTGFGIQSDHLELDCHGPVNTHIDALNHVGLFGTWFDGTPQSEVGRLGSVLGLAEFGIFTRAVHADIAAARGTDFVQPDREITGADIDAALARANVTFEPGDALLIDSGREKYEKRYGPWQESSPRSGSGPDVARWVVEHKPGLILWDLMDGDNTLGIVGPVHQLNWAVGLVMVDNCDFSRARPVLAGRGTATAGLVVAPLPIEGATGNNVNPMLLL